MDKEYPKRTLKQNSSIHVYCRELAESLNYAGYDMKKTLKPEVEIPWNEDMVKEFLWKSIQHVMYPDIESTADLNTAQASKVYEVVDRFISSKFGVHVPFPSNRSCE